MQIRVAEAKNLHIDILLSNAAHFIKNMRRKQVLIQLKQELERAIENRDNDINSMKE
jgi:hypothetical protein